MGSTMVEVISNLFDSTGRKCVVVI